MKYLLAFIALTALSFSCSSDMDRLVDRTCECLEAEAGGQRFRDCMGDDYETLGEYDHSENEKEFTLKVREQCPTYGAEFRL